MMQTIQLNNGVEMPVLGYCAETLFPYVLVCRGGLCLLEPQCLLLFVPCGIVLIYNNTADFLGFLRLIANRLGLS